MKRKFKFFSVFRNLTPEKVTAIAAIFISVCALVTTVYQTYILEQQKHAAVWPRLTLLHSWSTGKLGSHYRITLENVGIGPALIEEVKIKYKGDTDFQSLGDLAIRIANTGKVADSVGYYDHRDVFEDMVIPQQDKWVLLEILDDQAVTNFVEAIPDLDIQIIYGSLYGKRYQVSYPLVDHKELD